jgi:uncharacterized alpha-E superfamily protein
MRKTQSAISVFVCVLHRSNWQINVVREAVSVSLKYGMALAAKCLKLSISDKIPTSLISSLYLSANLTADFVRTQLTEITTLSCRKLKLEDICAHF